MFSEFRFFPGDKVINVEPHRDEQGFLVHLNQVGEVQVVNELEAKSVTVLWSNDLTTTVSVVSITPYQRLSSLS